MRARFVLDESSWDGAARDYPIEALNGAVERLLRRLDAARERDERFVHHESFYETELDDGVRFYATLFQPDCAVRLDPDLAQGLALALDRADHFDDSALTSYDAEFGGETRFAPGLAWAHASCGEGYYVAVFPLLLGEVPSGEVEVTVACTTQGVFFVTRESHHVAFFRSLFKLEKVNEAEFARLARSAFPTLDWADNVWGGLGDFSCPYVEIRERLVRCLGGLSDHGTACFRELQPDPRELAAVLSAKIGAPTSDENGATKKHAPSRIDRTRRHRGRERVFWWHVKLQPNIDRVHFLYEAPSSSASVPREGRIVVGLFKYHCILPA